MRLLIPDERQFEAGLFETEARQYVELVLAGAEVLEIRLIWQRRVVAIWDVTLRFEGNVGNFFLVGGDIPFLLLSKDEGLTTVAEALTVYSWTLMQWYQRKGNYQKEDFYIPTSWEPLDYFNSEHTDWLTLRDSYIAWHLLPKMIYDGELKNPNVLKLAKEIGNDAYHQQLLEEGCIDDEAN